MILSGVLQVRKNLEELIKLYPRAAKVAMYNEAQGVWAEAVKRAPIKDGFLRKSGYVAPPARTPADEPIEVGFSMPYAIIQHERTDFNHPRGGEAKYLENAFRVRQGGMAQRLIDDIKRLIERHSAEPSLRQAPTRPTQGRKRRLKVRIRTERRKR